MAKQGFRAIDVEPHLEEPFDLWEKNLPEKWRSRIKIIAPPRDRWHLDLDSARAAYFERNGDTVTVDVTRSDDGEPMSASRVAIQANRRWPDAPHLVKARNPYSTPEVYLEGFDIEGVDVGMLMPTSFGGIIGYDGYDPGLALAMCQIYNDWAYQFCRTDPERLKWWAVVPLHDPKAAAQEARRCMRELDAVGVTGKDGGGNLANDPALEPFWAELNALHAPVGFHGFCEGHHVDRLDPRHQRTDWIKPRFGWQGPHAGSVAGLIFGGVLDEFPNIKPIFMESGADGVPYMLSKMDDDWSMYGPDAGFSLEMWPSEYYKTHCYAVTYTENLLKYSVDYLGDDHLVFSTDYPHHDSPFPNGVKNFVEMEEISAESKRKILWDNAATLFGIAE